MRGGEQEGGDAMSMTRDAYDLYEKQKCAEHRLQAAVNCKWAERLSTLATQYAMTRSGYSFEVIDDMVRMVAEGKHPGQVVRHYERLVESANRTSGESTAARWAKEAL